MHVLTSPVRLLVGLLLAGVLLGACALQPQILPITPQIDLGGATARGAGRSLSLHVVDARPDNVVGYRDPTDKNSVITTAPETVRVIQRELEKAYGQLGFAVVPQGGSADVALEVRLTELGYSRQTGRVMNDIHTGATVEVTSVMHDKTVNGTYTDSQGSEMVLKPNLADNAELMNKHLGAALSRMAADARLTTE